MCASSTGCWPRRSRARGGRAPAPGDGRLVVDVDSFIGEVHGYEKQGAGFGYTKQRGYHPLLASRADTGEVLHVRLRKGKANCKPRGAAVRRGADRPRRARRRQRREAAARRLGVLEQQADEAAREGRLAATRSASACRTASPSRSPAIPESDWQPLEDYPDDGEAQIAETTLGGKRLIVRRTRLIGPQAELWPDWRHFPFLTNRTEALELVEAEHRQHAVVELTIRDLKDQALAHFPSGQFNANSAWTVIAAHRAQPAPAGPP